MQRRGRKGLAMYRIVVQDKRTHPTREKVIARLGSYNPHTKELNLDKELAQKYLDNGAQPSDRAIKALKEAGVKLPTWVKSSAAKSSTIKHADKLRKNQPKEEPEAKEEPQEEAAAEESKEEPSTDEEATAETTAPEEA